MIIMPVVYITALWCWTHSC